MNEAWKSLVCLALILVSSGASTAHPLETVEVGHWSYVALRHLASVGLISLRDLGQQPLTREEIARLVRAASAQASTRPVPADAADLLVALRREFLPDAEGERVFGAGTIQATTAVPPSLTIHPAGGGTAGTGLGIGSPGWLLWIEGMWEGSAITPARGYVSTKLGSVYLEAGRDVQHWGGSPRSSLILSQDAGALDMLRLSFDRPHIRFSKFGTRLTSTPERYLIGTRVDWMLSDRLRAGFSEAVVAQPSGLLLYHVLNPLPTLLSTLLDIVRLQNYSGTNDNPLGTIDFDLIVSPKVSVYGQLLVDDMARFYPNRTGFMVGGLVSEPMRMTRTQLRVEYSRVQNWTYTDMTGDGNHYGRNGRNLGHWLGPDGDDLYLAMTSVRSPEISHGVWLAMTRHGEGRLGRVWTTPDEAQGDAFLSGVVETRYAIGAEYLQRTPGAWTRYWAEVASVTNRNNVSGASGLDVRVGLEWSYRW